MDTSTLSDKELVTRILAGHPDLFGPLVERHIRAAHAIAYARLGNTADAEDAVQEAFLRAYESLATLREPTKFAAWLLTIARHEATRVAAKRNRAPISFDLSDRSDSSDLSDERSAQPDPAQREMNEMLRSHVMQLPEPAREVLLLHYFAGHSAREIASLLDLRRAAVLKRLQRAREQLAETMLRDLEAVRPSPNSLAPQVARIVALAAAIKIAAATAVPAAAAGFTLAALLTKPAVVATLIATAGIVSGYSILTVAGAPAEPRISDNTARSARSASPRFSRTEEARGDPAPAPLEPAAAPPATRETEVVQALAIASASSEPEEKKTLTGVWRMWNTEDTDPTVDLGSGADFTLTQRGPIVEFQPRDPDPNSWAGEGSLLAGRLKVTLKSEAGEPAGNEVYRLEGPCDPAADEFVLRGTITSPESAYIAMRDGQEHLIQPQMQNISTRWRRMSADMLSKEAFKRERMQEIQRLRDALRKFPLDNRGRVPQRIEELAPVYLTSLQAYRPEAGVQLTYTPRPALPSMAEVYPQYNDVIGPNPAFGQGLNMQQRFIAVENALRSYWGHRFLGSKNVVEAVYEQFDLVLVITEEGNYGTPEDVSCRKILPPSPPSAAEWGRKVASCQNNMKQAALTLKMFANEVPGEERFPAGWYMLYPEYMPDRCVLVCPGANKAEMSYELLFPAVSEMELEATYDSLIPRPAQTRASSARAYKQAHIPIVIEVDECSGSGGRNVLFLDGHTEHRKGRLEDHPDLAPFLNLK